jgi:hypothetical protein
VSFGAAYGPWRVAAFLFLSKNAKPPYHALVFHPSAGGMTGSIDRLDSFSRIDFTIRAGRAVIAGKMHTRQIGRICELKESEKRCNRLREPGGYARATRLPRPAAVPGVRALSPWEE